jgi:hypothetical protein
MTGIEFGQRVSAASRRTPCVRNRSDAPFDAIQRGKADERAKPSRATKADVSEERAYAEFEAGPALAGSLAARRLDVVLLVE